MAFNEKMNELKDEIEKERKNFKISLFSNQIMKYEANTNSISLNHITFQCSFLFIFLSFFLASFKFRTDQMCVSEIIIYSLLIY